MLAAGATCGPNVADTTRFVLGLHPVSASSSFVALRRLSYDVPKEQSSCGPTLKGVNLRGPHVPALNSSEHSFLGVHRNKVGSSSVEQSDLWRSQSSHARSVTCSAKKSAKSGGNEENNGKQAAPPRVSTNINIPVRYQLRYVKALKEYQKGAHGPPVRQTTGYRKKKERTSEGSGDVVAPSTSLMGKGVMDDLNIDPPVLLVDGYNMCGYWPKLKKHFAKGDLEAARSKLIVELQAYGACKGIRVVVVFDAQKSGLASHSEGDKYVEVVFSADDTADSWIESEAQSLRDQGNHNVWVVTSDLAQQSMAYGLGATVWSCGLLIQEINQARKDMLKQLEEDRFIGDLSARQPTFEEAVSRDSFDKLATLYERLSRAEDGLSDGDNDVRYHFDEVSSPEDDVRNQVNDVSIRNDDVSDRSQSNEDDVSDAYFSDDSDHDVSGNREPRADDVSRWNEGSEAWGSYGENESEGRSFALEHESSERRATGALAETSGRSDAHDAAAVGGRHAAAANAIPVAFGKGRVDLGAAVKRRRQTGGGYSSGSDSDGPPQRPARKRAQELDSDIFQRFDTLPDFGYGTGEDDHRGRMHRGWRDVERAVEDGKARGVQNGSNGRVRHVSGGGFGASRETANGTGRAAGGINGNGNGTTSGANGNSNGANGKSSGANGTASRANGMASGTSGTSGTNGTGSRFNGAAESGTNGLVGGAENGTNERARLGEMNTGRGLQDGVPRNGRVVGKGIGNGIANGNGGVLGETGSGSPTEAVPANGHERMEHERNGARSPSLAGLGNGVLGHEELVESIGQVQGDMGPPLVIRGTTKRVPGQSVRVVKPREKEFEQAAGDGNGEQVNVAYRAGNGWNGKGLELSRENGAKNELGANKKGRVTDEIARVGGIGEHWDLMADPRLMRSPMVQPNGTINGKRNASAEGNKQIGKGRSKNGNGMSGRKGASSPSKSGGEKDFGNGVHEGLEGTPFDELTTVHMLALKFGHSSETGSENGARSSTRHTRQGRKRNT